jgi:hypothetical protein
MFPELPTELEQNSYIRLSIILFSLSLHTFGMEAVTPFTPNITSAVLLYHRR